MKKITLTLAALAVAGVAQIANAQITPLNPSTPGLVLVNGASTVVGTYDGSGAWSFSGTVGSYFLTVTTGALVQSGSSPIMDLDVDVTTAGTGALDIMFTGGAFGPTAAGYTLNTSSFVTTTGGTVSSYLYQDTTLLGGSADSTTGAVLNSSGTINGEGYYLTMEDVVNGGVVSADSTAAVSSVPEASTIMAGALMLLPLGAGAFRVLRKERMA